MKNYIDQYKILHRRGKYGTSSEKLYEDILSLVKEVKHRSVLDYGCGQSKLIDILPIPIKYKYDPAIKKYEKLPTYATVIDLVICTDVLEHIPEEDLFSTLSQIYLYSNKVIFSIAIIPAKKILPNGENAHCTVKPINWWTERILEIFKKVSVVKIDRNVKFICKTW